MKNKKRGINMDIVDNIIAYESGDMNDTEMLELFSELIKSGQAWILQGHYGRTAVSLIEANLITKEGDILWDNLEQ